jgi:hypothetical protein
VAIKNGNDKIYMMLNWRHPYRDVNGIGIVHHTNNQIERISYPAVTNSNPNPQSGYYGYEEKSGVPVTNANGDTDYFSGLSSMEYGNYLIYMNSREIGIEMPKGVGSYRDLISGKIYHLSEENTIPANTTLVLWKLTGSNELWTVESVKSSGIDVNTLEPNAVIDEVTVQNNADEQAAVVIVALYDKNQLIDCYYTTISTEIGSKQTIYPNITLPKDTTNYVLKVFVWNDKTLESLANVFNIS